MIQPGGGVSQAKGAQTRFNNDLQRAAQGSVRTNPVAAASLKQKVKPRRTTSAAPVGQMSALRQAPQGLSQPPQQFQGAPAGPVVPDLGQDFEPERLIPGEVESLVNNARLDKLMTSPEIRGAMTSIRLHDHFNRDNPSSIPDQRPTIERVLNRLKLTYEDL